MNNFAISKKWHIFAADKLKWFNSAIDFIFFILLTLFYKL